MNQTVVTLQDVFDILISNTDKVLFYFGGLIILVLLLNWITKNETDFTLWSYIYSVITYIVCIPGVFACVLSLESMLNRSKSMLEVPWIIYIAPIFAMLIVTQLIKRNVSLTSLPGFDRLAGLLVMIAATFGIILFIQRTRIWVVFGGSMGQLLMGFVVVFLAIFLGWKMLTKKA